MKTELLRNYQSLAKQYQSISDSKNKQIKWISFTRFISFIAIFPAFFYLSPVNLLLAVSVSLFFLVSFLLLIKKFIQTEKQLLYYQRLIAINKNEICALNHDFTPFDPGNEFIDPHHDYNYDLDLFGKGSLFQFLNRTVTGRGEIHLAKLLNQNQHPANEIKAKQFAIAELAENLSWRQNFMAKGYETVNQLNQNHIDASTNNKITLKHAKITKYLPFISPAFILVFIGLNTAGLVSSQIYLIALFIQYIIFQLYSKTISKFYRQFESQSKILRRYADMLYQIETLNVKSDYLIDLQGKLSVSGKTASEITAELQNILNQFDYRQNLIVAFILNFIFLWDIRCVSKLYQWQQKYSSGLPKWFGVIAEIDALVSLANCNYNHPEWITPQISDSSFQFKTENMGHPLIDEKRCVKNSFLFSGEEHMVIITGANMAGKSTFLRTVGVNLILASNGCNVCASSFEFSPIRVFTNMRTSDNLMNDESYFYAELLRLQTMLSLIRKGENLFVIVDEMLKGTNSVDKLNGSKELIRQMISLKTHGIVATHDLVLTELVHSYPAAIKNQCFEVQLNQDELKFDYKLTDGITRTMNATFLMKKMGIIPTD